jgi:hypothetical protein
MSVRLALQVNWLLWSETNVANIFRVGNIRTGSEVKVMYTPLHIFPCVVTAYNKHFGIAL